MIHDNIDLDLHGQTIIQEYLDKLEIFKIMETTVHDKLQSLIQENNIYVNAIESRIKSQASLTGKLLLKGHKYNRLCDITDILGVRVVTFYTDEVDNIALLIERIFDVDWQNSVDKRKIQDPHHFGYMSLHYICRIPTSIYYDPAHPEVNEYRFEVQMRSALQHVWATIEHDIGYKSGVEIPERHLRNINRLAGLLELADEQFATLRKDVSNYRHKMQSLVHSGNFKDVELNGDTFRSYLELEPFRILTQEIASFNQAEIYEDNLFPYLKTLIHLGFKTLGDIENMKEQCSNAAKRFAIEQLSNTDLDIIAQSLSLQSLCIIHIIQNGGSINTLQDFYTSINGSNKYSAERARKTYEQLQILKLI